jgi:serine/threonine-protein kinase
MSPEQIRSSKLDQRSDLYSLGVILYMAVTGHSPFKRDSSVHALLAQLEEPPPPIQVARPGLVLPRALEWTIFTLLEKDPDRRFARVEELMKALRVVEAECRGELPSLDGLTLENGRVVGPAGFADPGSVRMRAPSASPGEHSLSRPLPSPTPPPKPAMPPEAPRETPSPPPAAPPSPPSPPARDGAIRRRPARGPGAVRRDSEPSRLVLASLAFLALLLMSALVWLVSRPLEPAPEVVAPQVAGVPPALVPLLVRTEPAGADVVRQGEVLGRTPLEISLPRGESWRLELRQSGYVNRLIDVRGGEELPPLALTPVPRGDSRAPGATPSAPIAAPPPAEATPKRDPSPAPGSDLRDPWAG